ncbi:MAG: IS5/IS1182 family transposase, partial [Alphaproteobacteria bacterium]
GVSIAVEVATSIDSFLKFINGHSEVSVAGQKDEIATLKEGMGRPEMLEARMLAPPDQQISLTDPDVRSMATSGRGPGMVG